MAEKEKKIAALLRKSDVNQQTAVQIVSNQNLSSDKITETNRPELDGSELATRVSGVESIIPKIQVRLEKVSKKVDNLKASNNKKFERIYGEIDIIAKGIDDTRVELDKKVTKLTALIDKQKVDNKDKKKIEKGNDKILTVLTSMLDFMKRAYEEDTLLREQQNNFKEEQKAEKDRKDKALLEALKSKKKKSTAEKITEDKPSFLEKLLGAFASILGPLKALVESVGMVFKFLKNIFGPIGKFLIGIGRFFLMSPLGAALLLGTAAVWGLFKLLGNDKNPEQTSKMITNAANPDAAVAEAIMKTTEATESNAIERKKQNILAERPASEKSVLFWRDGEFQKKYLEKIGWDEKTGTTKQERDSGVIKIDESGKLVYKVEQPKPTETGTASTTAEGMANYKTRAPASPPGTTPEATPEASTPKSVPQQEKQTTDTAVPIVQTTNLGTKVADMSAENAITKTITEIGEGTSNQINNVMAATKKLVEHTIESIPSVRNQEETFQRMIFNSTRVV